jgi:hypothetical protein
MQVCQLRSIKIIESQQPVIIPFLREFYKRQLHVFSGLLILALFECPFSAA